MDGNEYAEQILRRNGNRIESLLEAAEYQETGWLEFKADPFCNKDRPPQWGNVIWHTLKAVVAMVNTRGGCIVFGVNDRTHNAVDLKMKDGRLVEDMDAYHRLIRSEILSPKPFTMTDEDSSQKDEKKKQKKERSDEVEVKGDVSQCSQKEGEQKQKKEKLTRIEVKGDVSHCCTFKSGATLNGKPVSVLFVAPLKKDEFCYVAVNHVEKLPVRIAGAEGNTELRCGADIRSWERPPMEFDRLSEFAEKRFDNLMFPVGSFIGRKQVLARIRDCIAPELVRRRKIPLVYGPAGIGKTETVLKYAQLYRREYESLIFIDASKHDTLTSAVASVVRNSDFRRAFLSGVSRDEQDQQDDTASFMSFRHLVTHGDLGHTLIVLDDVRHPNVIRPEILGRYLGGRDIDDHLDVIVTARCPRLRFYDGDEIVPIGLERLKREEGVRLLDSKRPLGKGCERAADEIVRMVGGNPWALDLVGEYLKQKTCWGEDDYEDCLNQIRREMRKGFPPEDRTADRVGNVTGVLKVGDLLRPTIDELLPEEKDICQIAASVAQEWVLETGVRSALAGYYERAIDDAEWQWLRQSLDAKCVFAFREEEHGCSEMSFRDKLMARWYAEMKRTPAIGNARLEYMKAGNRTSAGSSHEGFSTNLDVLLDACVDRYRAADIAFDVNRMGWPLGIMGIDTVGRVAGWENAPEVVKKIRDLCDKVAGIESCKADVFEILATLDPDEDVESRFKRCTLRALEMREELYAESPLMLGRSYLHVAYQGSGILKYEQQLGYLDKAIQSLSRTDKQSRWLAEAMDLKARILDDIYTDPDQSYCSPDDIPDQIRNLVSQAYDIYPALYQDIDEEDFRHDVNEGRYPSN